MNVFIAGLTGATGQLLAIQLLQQGHDVWGYARNLESLPAFMKTHPNLHAKQGSLLELADDVLREDLSGMDAIVSCLGHNLNAKGLWGHPKTLVLDAVRKLTELAPERPIRFVLMGSNGVANQLKQERFSLPDQMVIQILRKVLPPHRDNELAADFLQSKLTRKNIEWCIVRPDNLRDAPKISAHQAFDTQQKGVVFQSGFTSRINVAHFMEQLLTDKTVWQHWAGKWPVLYNKEALV